MENTNSIRVVVSFPARNEEGYISQVLDSLVNQTLKPVRIIIANDGSTDNTEEIANSYDIVDVHNREFRENTIVGKIGMANVWNDSITPAEKIHEVEPIDYILTLGGDLVLSETYIEQLVEKFEADPDLMFAAGLMVGEHAIKPSGFMMPGGGRMGRYSYWLKIGGQYPQKHGWEAYPIYKANLEGYKTKVFHDIEYYPLRPTGGRTDYKAYGESMKALGYFFPFAIGRILKQPFMGGRGIGASWNMLLGYLFGKPEYYEEELRKFIRSTQVKRIKRIFRIGK